MLYLMEQICFSNLLESSTASPCLGDRTPLFHEDIQEIDETFGQIYECGFWTSAMYVDNKLPEKNKSKV